MQGVVNRAHASEIMATEVEKIDLGADEQPDGVYAESSIDTVLPETLLVPEEEPDRQDDHTSISSSLEEQKQTMEQVRRAVAQRQTELVSANPSLSKRSLSELNSEATKMWSSCDNSGAVAVYNLLFSRAAQLHITHPELFVCHSNCSAACLKIGLYEDALVHAYKCAQLAESSLRRNPMASASYIKSFIRKGQALLALRRHREAVATFESGLALDPLNPDLKLGLQNANKLVLEDLLAGKGHEHRSITYPEPSQRITFHPYDAPLHKVRTEEMLPVRLLTPFQAENDHHIKDTYNYMTVQADVRMPTRMFQFLEDPYYNAQWSRAIAGAVKEIEDNDMDARVLNLGAGAGVQAATALRAGARHVTAVERWLYLSLATKEMLDTNFKGHSNRYQVLYKRPTDLKIQKDVAVCCNLVIANILDDGLLSSGIIPAVRYAMDNLATQHPVILPASATVYMQAVEFRTTHVCGFDMSAANLYRWHPSYSTGAPLDMSKVRILSKPVPVWYFDFGAPPEASDVKTVDVEFTDDGRFNAVMFWYDLHLWGDVNLSTGPDVATAASGQKALQPAMQYLAGELRVDSGTIMPVIASHNTVKMRFDIETADYLHLMKPDPTFPHRHFNMLADASRLEAYDRAIKRAIDRAKSQSQSEGGSGEAHVLDMGTGTGVLALAAARAGANSVVACELHASLCDVARKSVAFNGLSKRVSVVHRDVALLQRGKEVRPLGVNIIIADMFDAGLTGDQFTYLLDMTLKKVAQPEATVIPAAATLYCMGIEALTADVEGFNLSSFNAYRWSADYQNVRVNSVPHRRLTRPVKVSELFFDGEKKKSATKTRESLVKFDVIQPGVLNSVVFWFDLHLDDVDTITSAPAGIDVGGVVEVDADNAGDDGNDHEHYWGQALQYLDRSVAVQPGRKVTLLAKRDGTTFRLSLRPGIGEWVGRAPWKIEWGGGASVENPHYQRVHYCELLVRDFLMRCKSQRFPPIQKDIAMVVAHCGSLFLDPTSLEEAGHELNVLEKLHIHPEFSPGASLEALTRRPLSRC